MRFAWLLVTTLGLAGALGCSGGGDNTSRAIVRVISPTPTSGAGSLMAGPGSLPTPTSTPIPPPEVLLSTVDVYQAGAILVSVVGEISDGTVTFFNRTLTLTQGTQSMYTFAAVGIDDPPGQQPLRVDFTLKNGTKGSQTLPVNVLRTEWTVDALTFSEEQVDTLLDPKVVADENRLLAEMYSTFTPRKLWDVPWQVPVEGALTARFGEQRSINGGPPSGHHGGTDFGAVVGTTVRAANRGRVLMARQTQLRGNMVIIDHGGGLLSGYGHLDSFSVAEGEEVAAGELIGRVGNTGLSTGAHLHWEISAGGILIDALRFTDGSNGF